MVRNKYTMLLPEETRKRNLGLRLNGCNRRNAMKGVQDEEEVPIVLLHTGKV